MKKIFRPDPGALIVDDETAASMPWVNSLWFKFIEHHWGCLFEWESKYLDMLVDLKESREIKSIIDIGANTGAVSIFLSVLFNPQKIVCIEPDLSNFIFLKYAGRHMLTEHTKVSFINGAIYYSEAEEMSMFSLSEEVNPGGKFLEPLIAEKLLKTGGFQKDPNLVKIKTLEYVASALGVERADLVKIDVEGAEWNIIENSSFLREKTDLIFLEYHDRSLEETLDFLETNLPNHELIKQVENSVVLKLKG